MSRSSSIAATAGRRKSSFPTSAARTTCWPWKSPAGWPLCPTWRVTILHVVPRSRSTPSTAAGEMERLFTEPAMAQQVRFKVVQDDSPVDVVVQHAQNSDLTIIGVAEEWGLESQLFGFRSERIAREVESSLLIVRRHKTVAAAGRRGPRLRPLHLLPWRLSLSATLK